MSFLLTAAKTDGVVPTSGISVTVSSFAINIHISATSKLETASL